MNVLNSKVASSWIAWILVCIAAPVSLAQNRPASDQTRRVIDDLLAGRFQWRISGPLVAPIDRPEDPCCSVKDPSAVYYQGRWHLFCTIRSQNRSHQIEYLSFTDWKEAGAARRHVLKTSDGFFCAPQVFYFAPGKRWYLICQASKESWQPKYGAAYCTTTDIAAPNSWSQVAPLGAKQAKGKSGLDFWVIADESKAYLFFTTLDGRLWREKQQQQQQHTDGSPGKWENHTIAPRKNQGRSISRLWKSKLGQGGTCLVDLADFQSSRRPGSLQITVQPAKWQLSRTPLALRASGRSMIRSLRKHLSPGA